MAISKIKVAGHLVLLKPEFPEVVSEGGIIIATESGAKRERAQTDTGRVIAVGPTCWHAYDKYTPDGSRNPSWGPWCRVGDMVLFAKYSGKFVKIDDEDYVIVPDVDIQAVLVEDATVESNDD